MSCIQKAVTLKSLHPPWNFNIKGHRELHTEGGNTEVIALPISTRAGTGDWRLATGD